MNADGQPDDAIEVLREVWALNGQGAEDLLDALGPQKSCKNMENVGFDGWPEAQAEAGGQPDLRGAWRATLEREGKLSRGSGSVRDLVVGQSEPKR